MNCYLFSCFFFSHLSTVTFFPVSFFPTCPLLLSFLLLFFLPETVTFFPVTFFPVTFFPCTSISALWWQNIWPKMEFPELFVPADEVRRGHRNGERVSVRWSVCPGFPTIIWKSNGSIHLKFGVGIYWVSVQNWFAFGWRWPNFGPPVAKKWLKMGQNGGFQPLSEKVFTQSNYWVSVQKWFAFWPRWPNFGPLVATKWLKMVVSDHYLKKYSRKPIQFCCVHLLGECS